MAAVLKIDQAGLSAGTSGKARLDGKADGSLVTLTSVSPGTTNEFRLLYVPPDDDEAIDSLTPTGGGATPVWTFSPKAGVRGAYRVELIINAGLSTESRQQKVFGIASWRHELVPPALNEIGDPTARSALSGTALTDALARTDRNVDRNGDASADGWQRVFVDIVDAIEIGNYAQMVVPESAVCIVPEGQTMYFQGGLFGDYAGDLVEIGLGTQGPQGPAGADGVDGADGADGAEGPQGPPGAAAGLTELIQATPQNYTFSANAATLDVSTRNDFIPTNTLTGNSTITLTNGVDGCQGTIYVKQDATGSRTLSFSVSGRTILREQGSADSNPQAAANTVTGYSYDFKTIAGTAYVVIERFMLT